MKKSIYIFLIAVLVGCGQSLDNSATVGPKIQDGYYNAISPNQGLQLIAVRTHAGIGTKAVTLTYVESKFQFNWVSTEPNYTGGALSLGIWGARQILLNVKAGTILEVSPGLMLRTENLQLSNQFQKIAQSIFEQKLRALLEIDPATYVPSEKEQSACLAAFAENCHRPFGLN